MRIGALAAAAGLPTQTIRFYERKGLLPTPPRSSNGYRKYDASTLARLAFIRQGQAAGLTLVEIATILDLRGAGTIPCAHVGDLLASKLHDVQQRLRELADLEAELHGLIRRSRQLDPADCTDAAVCHIIGSDAPPERAAGPRQESRSRT